MPSDPLIVPTVVPGGSLHFATVTSGGKVQDVLDALILNSEVTSEVLGDLEPYGWAVQRIRHEHHGRQWEEEELSLDARTSVLEGVVQRLRSGDRIPDDEMARLRRLARPANAQGPISGADITVKEMFVGRKTQPST